MATEGLLQWANNIRLTMATDPGRALFKEQVQIHGFSFLDDYLDNILSNAKPDTLLELVKTPGRKRTLTKKPKPTSKLKQGITLFSEDEERGQAIPQEITTGAQSNLQHHQPELARGAAPVKTPNVQVSHCDALGVSEASSSTLVNPLPHNKINELSIIAEDDEMAERSHVSLPLDVTAVRPSQEGSATGQDTNVTVEPPTNDALPSCIAESASKEAEPQISPIESHGNTTESNMDANDNHVSLKSEVNNNSRRCETPENGEVVVPQSSVKDDVTDNLGVALDLHETGPAVVSPKAKSPSIPPIPAPVLLRKLSTTGVENPTGTSALGAVTPGGLTTGKRTSWLQKARQANLAIASRKATASLGGSSLTQPTSTTTTLFLRNMKRKSTDIFSGNEDDNERHHKVAKTTTTDAAPTNRNTIIAGDAGSSHVRPAKTTSHLSSEEPRLETRLFGEGDMLDLLKKTVEGLGSRTRKSAGKSLGGSLATSLAEARAAAEARIAERKMKEEETMNIAPRNSLLVKPSERHEESTSPSESQPLVTGQGSSSIGQSSESSRTGQPTAILSKVSHEPTFNIEPATGGSESRTKTTTTPTSSPPSSNEVFRPPPGPVFNKPPPVFVPPKHVERIILPSSSKGSLALKLTSEYASSVEIFSKEKNTPIWMSTAQDTLHSTSQNINVCDEDDSWPMDDKLEEGVQWVYGNAKDDNTTWSSLPSQQNTGNLSQDMVKSGLGLETQDPPTEAYIRRNSPDVYDTDADQRDEMQNATSDSELDEGPQTATMSTISLVESSKARNQGQISNSSSESQQANVGFFGQATKLISNMMGSGTKTKPEVKKVLQLAAARAKKQQEESDKKAARLKEMGIRRYQAMQRKAEEEKARIVEQEKKLKEENERRKREREEHTDKRPLKITAGRKEDDTMKKRKIEVEKKSDIKRSAVNPPKSSVKLGIKQPSALSSSTAYNSSFNTNGGPTVASKTGETGTLKPGTTAQASLKGKGKMVVKTAEEDLAQPSQIVQTQMAARAKAQLRAAEQVNEPPVTPSESIELPDINSEYSDSEDEDRQRTFDPPDWAQSPELRQALQQQSTINPDDIFGAIRPLKMEEIFKSRRFRARTSSANWAGADRLTAEEEREYARRMGFK
ncbi:hypothetical protein F5887DRAFT_943645 [Amanita rubescens]|nr:hypothetical protein F5887DRAFT_943645 [Amanita rubescens]